MRPLGSWRVLLPDVADKFRELEEKRHRAIHFNPDTDHNDRALSLQALLLLQEIVALQFGAFGPLPWFIPGTPGVCYLKRSVEDEPFIKEVYLPNCARVGPNHTLDFREGVWVVASDGPYDTEAELTDEEFRDRLLRNRGADV